MTLAAALLAVKIGFAEAAGFVVLLPACVANAWELSPRVSIKQWPGGVDGKPPYRPVVDRWSWNWLNAWYANIEDGVSGQKAYVWQGATLAPYKSLYPSWTPRWVIAYGWSAWRNGANNIKRPLRADSN